MAQRKTYRERLTKMLGEILNRLERLETSVDQLFKQETLLSAQVAELFERMETGFREFGERQDRIEREIRENNRTLGGVNVDLATRSRSHLAARHWRVIPS